MRVACLILEDQVFANSVKSFGDYGLSAARYTDEMSLLRALRIEPIDAVLVDVGADPALESQVFACIQRVAVGRVPFVLQTTVGLAHRNALALRAGIADVVTRGMEAVELVARLVAAARRTRPDQALAPLSHAGFVLDPVDRTITDRGAGVDLTPREFALAWLLFSNPGRCASRRLISLAVWGVDSEISSRTMEQHIHQLRKKLGLGPERGVSISAVYGAGYLLAVHGGQQASVSGHAEAVDASSQAGSRPGPGSHPRQVDRIDWLLAGLPSLPFAAAVSPAL
jgi:two-component system, OmpR family, response regulator QseB